MSLTITFSVAIRILRWDGEVMKRLGWWKRLMVPTAHTVSLVSVGTRIFHCEWKDLSSAWSWPPPLQICLSIDNDNEGRSIAPREMHCARDVTRNVYINPHFLRGANAPVTKQGTKRGAPIFAIKMLERKIAPIAHISEELSVSVVSANRKSLQNVNVNLLKRTSANTNGDM